MALILLVLFSNCKKDDDPNSSGNYTDGVFIVEQGNFGSANASVSYYRRDEGIIIRDIYKKENPDLVLGDIAQSIEVFDGKAYIVVNNSDKIEIVDEKSFKSVGTINGLALPRYILFKDHQTAYVSQWGADGISGSVAVVNLHSRQVETTILTGSGPERMKLHEGRLYVANAGGFGRDSTIAVVDIEQKKVVKRITVAEGPSNIVEAFGDLFVLCSGVFDAGIGGFTPGAFARINRDSVIALVKNIEGSPANLIAIEVSSSTVDFYFTSYNGMFKSTAVNGLPGLPIRQLINPGYFYALGWDVQSNRLFASDAKDFNSEGAVFLLDREGQILDTLPAGIIPCQFYFQ